MRLTFGLVVGIALLGGCKDKGEGLGGPLGAEPGAAPGQTGPAPKLEWNDYKLKVSGEKAEASFFMSTSDSEEPTQLGGYFSDFPPGTSITLGTAKGTASDSGYFSTKVDVRDKLGELPLEAVFSGKVDLMLTVTLVLPGRAPVTEKLPPLDVKKAVGRTLARSQDRPVLFGTETEATKDPLDTAILVNAFGDPRLFGKGKLVRDVDWVAVETRTDSGRTKPCTGYKEGKTITLELLDSELELFDRRAGKSLKKQSFKASDECPTIAFVSGDGKSKAYASDKELDKWLRAELAKVSK